uniref:Methyltransferase type 11 domain-containing protein n=1 Tax=Picea sitchensis TaxID=3332 RepID=A9NQD7_PICSI|nr:unknown [Picea sitchensis]
MAGLFDRQAREYANGRPQYPPQLFSLIAKHSPHRRLAWDVGTGSGQAALALSEIFERVIATDVSEQQISYAPRRPNITYTVTPRQMSLEELESTVGAEGSVDLVTVAQALHFFDLHTFYGQVKHVLRKPGGVFAAWCYNREAVVNPSVDRVFQDLYRASDPFWTPARQLVDSEYTTIDFPFRSVAQEGSEGEESTTAPIKFWAKKELGFEGYLSLIRSWSAYQIAKGKGVELLDDQIVARLKQAWGGSDEDVKTVSWPVFLRIGVV